MAEGAGTTNSQPTTPSLQQPSGDAPLSRQRSPAAAPSQAPAGDPPPTDSEAPSNDDPRPRALLTFRLEKALARRGTPLAVSGTVLADDEPCAFSRVDVSLQADRSAKVVIGALPTDENGRFKGQITIPLGVEVGDYSVSVSTPGTTQCAPSD
jgi:hypothetical protein